MTGQVERQNTEGFGKRVNVEEPVSQIAAKAVQEHHGHFGFRSARSVADPDAVDACAFKRRAGVVRIVSGGRKHETLHKAVDFLLADLRLGKYAQEGTDRERLAGTRNPPAQQTRVGRFNRVADLVGFHIHDRGAHSDPASFVDQPIHNRSFAHLEPPFRHDDGGNACGSFGCAH